MYDGIDSTSTTVAATANAVKKAGGQATQLAGASQQGQVVNNATNWGITYSAANDGKGTVQTVDASTSAKGIVQLYDGIDSTSTTVAATANAVKTTYDLANSKADKSTYAGTSVYGLATSSTNKWNVSFTNGVGSVNTENAGTNKGLAITTSNEWGVSFTDGVGSVNTVIASTSKLGLIKAQAETTAWAISVDANGLAKTNTVKGDSTTFGLVATNTVDTSSDATALSWGVRVSNGLGNIVPKLAGGAQYGIVTNNNTDWGITYSTANDGKGSVKTVAAGDALGLAKSGAADWQITFASGVGTVNTAAASTTQAGIVQLSDATDSTSTTLAATANAVSKKWDNTAQIWLKIDDYGKLLAVISTETDKAGWTKGTDGLEIRATKAKWAQYLVSDITKPDTDSAVYNTLITQSTENDGVLKAHILELT